MFSTNSDSGFEKVKCQAMERIETDCIDVLDLIGQRVMPGQRSASIGATRAVLSEDIRHNAECRQKEFGGQTVSPIHRRSLRCDKDYERQTGHSTQVVNTPGPDVPLLYHPRCSS